MTHIGGVLKRYIAKMGLSGRINASRVCEVWDETVVESLGKAFKDKTKAQKFQRGTLFVVVFGSAYANRLSYEREDLARAVNKKLGSRLVVDIKLCVTS